MYLQLKQPLFFLVEKMVSHKKFWICLTASVPYFKSSNLLGPSRFRVIYVSLFTALDLGPPAPFPSWSVLASKSVHVAQTLHWLIFVFPQDDFCGYLNLTTSKLNSRMAYILYKWWFRTFDADTHSRQLTAPGVYFAFCSPPNRHQCQRWWMSLRGVLLRFCGVF